MQDGSTACGPRAGGRLCAAGGSGTRSGCVLEVVQVDKGRTFVCCSRLILASMWLSGLKLECVSLYCCRLHHHQHQSIFSPQRGHRFHPSSDSEISKLRSERSGYGGRGRQNSHAGPEVPPLKHGAEALRGALDLGGGCLGGWTVASSKQRVSAVPS